MEKEYLNCKNRQTSRCPHVDTEIMQKFIGNQTSAGQPIERFTSMDLEDCDLLCRNCGSFELREE